MRNFTFPSSSSPGVIYTTILHDDGHATCNCPGYTKRSARSCKHTKQVGGVATPPVPALFDLTPTIPVEPMLANELPEERKLADYSSPDWILEEKYDGHRMIISVGNEVTAWSRGGKIRLLIPRIVEGLRHLTPGLYDGELIIPGGTSTDVTAVGLVEQSELVLFDCLQSNDLSLVNEQFLARRVYLEEALLELPMGSPLRLAQQCAVSLAALQNIWDCSGEGAIAKRLTAPYQAGKRSMDWIKFVRAGSAATTITGFKEGLMGPYSRIVAVDRHGVTVTVKSLNSEWLRWFADDANRFIGKTLVISYRQRLRSGRYRHPMADHIL